MVHFAAYLRRNGPIFVQFYVAALEKQGKMQLICSSMRRSSKIRGDAAPTSAAPLRVDAAHLNQNAAHLEPYREHVDTRRRRGEKEGRRGAER